jgi:phosphoglycolate phosphatase-like HAD superfamily hydrolase
MKKVLSHVNEIKKVKDAEHIKRLKAKKILVSNSLKEFILPVLKHLRIKDEFQEIYGADDFPDKADFIKDYIKKRGFSKEEIYYIGDRVADVKLARKIGIKSVIISTKASWNSRREVLKEKPDFLIFDLDNLKEVIS